MRLRIAELGSGGGALEWITGHLRSTPDIQSFHITSACASVVVYYDPGSPQIAEATIAALRCVSLTTAPAPVLPPAPPPRSLFESVKHVFHRIFNFLLNPHGFLWSSIAVAGSLISAGPIAALTAPLTIACALPSLTRAWIVLRFERRFNVDFLDSVAILVSVGRAQFFTAAFIAWMISLGDWIRDRTAGRSKRALTDLLEFQTTMAWLVQNRKVIRVPSHSVVPGQRVLVYPGEMIPVDGVVVRGRASVDQKTVTGESLPVEREPGDEVFASTILRDGKLTIRAARVGAETTAAQIVQLIESAPVGETRIQNYAEQFGDRLVTPSLLLSGGIYAMSGNLDRLLAMLIVDYGTGIRVAAPTSVLAAMIHAARQGILIKSGRHMERLAELDTIVFDKTGTLTHGSPEVRDVISYDERHFPARKIMALAASAEARLKHPVSQALVAKAEADGIKIPERNDGDFEVGLGVQARINGYFVQIGNERFFTKKQIRFEASSSCILEANRKGWSTLLFAVDGVLKGVIPYADRIRPESRDVVQTLRNNGIKHVVMITGDNGCVGQAVAGQLGIDQCVFEALPSDKAEAIQVLQRDGHVVGMVGDGINDSPALAFADIGISMKHGADVARETADVVLMEDSLWKLVSAIEISRDAIKTIKQNYAIIAVLNTIALAMAIPPGLINPNISALISNGSAVLASLNAIRPVLND